MIKDVKLRTALAWILDPESKALMSNGTNISQEIGDRILFKTYLWEVIRTTSGQVIILTPEFNDAVEMDRTLWNWSSQKIIQTFVPSVLDMGSVADALCLIAEKAGLRYSIDSFHGDLKDANGFVMVGYRIVLVDAKRFKDSWLDSNWRHANRNLEDY